MEASREQTHFVLVHGICHGAWCWHKLKPRLKSAGHRVTALDLAASGINMKAIQDVHTFHDYSEPLLDLFASLPPNQKVILVGHSLGGLNLAIAMEKYPEKVAVGVFVTALMPDTTHKPSYVLDQVRHQQQVFGTSKFAFGKNMALPPFKLYFEATPNWHCGNVCYKLRCNLFKDLELAKTLVRPTSWFHEDLSKVKNFSNEGYGSVPQVYVVCDEHSISKEYQRWMIENGGAKDVMEIKGADHMAMFSKPQDLCHCLLEIARKYA
ncbi:LOW QUALITY PROTEIN: methylesterase 3-like [Corylus avellana]|uniref:LOW QUALITY PROTEIN: methylesterase 3-like n=1 Tax=Corylus avellana TaxID=13451 RepID=UPI00286B4F02|nr:LOW QUALITY PROTEIN: methylesterase 3-like [Corylus avellana]